MGWAFQTVAFDIFEVATMTLGLMLDDDELGFGAGMLFALGAATPFSFVSPFSYPRYQGAVGEGIFK